MDQKPKRKLDYIALPKKQFFNAEFQILNHVQNNLYRPKSFWIYNFGPILEGQGIRLFPGGNSDETSEANDLGGLRITTFMIYLNNVQAGGNTIFPQVKSF